MRFVQLLLGLLLPSVVTATTEASVRLLSGLQDIELPRKEITGSGSRHVVNGQPLKRFPDYLIGGMYHEVDGSIVADGQLVLKCPNGGCSFYIITYHCPPCSSAINGGLPAQLLTSGWEARGGACAPQFSTGSYSKHPMTIFKKDIQLPGDLTVTTTKKASFVGVISTHQLSGEFCPQPSKPQAGPQLPGGCSSNCASAPDEERYALAIDGLGTSVGIRTAAGRRIFRGVSYGLEPVMFQSPQINDSWPSFPVDNTKFGPMCWQPGSVGLNGERVQDRCHDADGWGPAWASLNVSQSDNNCLNLNIYAPPESDESFPVMVFIPGGGFYSGGANDLQIDHGFSDAVILVTINYRLGVQGFGYLGTEGAANTKANYGLQDQQVALTWVKKYIKHYGGDDTRITLFGESAGGTSVAYHYTNNESRQFFNQVILESAGIAQINSLEWERNNTMLVAAMLGYHHEGDHCPIDHNTYQEFNYRYSYTECNPNDLVPFLAGKTLADVKQTCSQRGYSCSGFVVDSENSGVVTGNYVLKPKSLTRNPQEVTASCTLDVVPPRKIYLKTILSSQDAKSCLLHYEQTAPQELVRYGTLLDVFPDTLFHNKWSPVVDGITLKKNITDLIIDGEGGTYPVMVGTNLDEGTLFIDGSDYILPNTDDETALNQWGRCVFGEAAVPVFEGGNYSVANLLKPLPQTLQNSNKATYWGGMRAGTDSQFRCRGTQIANHSNILSRDHVFMYLFDHVSVMDTLEDTTYKPLGVYHGLELEYLFSYTHDKYLPGESPTPGYNTDSEKALMKSMACYWATFAHYGKPLDGSVGGCDSTYALGMWQPYDGNKFLNLSASLKNISDPFPDIIMAQEQDVYQKRCESLVHFNPFRS